MKDQGSPGLQTTSECLVVLKTRRAHNKSAATWCPNEGMSIFFAGLQVFKHSSVLKSVFIRCHWKQSLFPVSHLHFFFPLLGAILSHLSYIPVLFFTKQNLMHVVNAPQKSMYKERQRFKARFIKLGGGGEKSSRPIWLEPECSFLSKC